jgi:hypothetical protein
LGDSQERHRDPDQDQGDSRRPLAHRFPPFRFCLDTFRVLLSPAGGGGVFSNAAVMSCESLEAIILFANPRHEITEFAE